MEGSDLASQRDQAFEIWLQTPEAQECLSVHRFSVGAAFRSILIEVLKVAFQASWRPPATPRADFGLPGPADAKAEARRKDLLPRAWQFADALNVMLVDERSAYLPTLDVDELERLAIQRAMFNTIGLRAPHTEACRLTGIAPRTLSQKLWKLPFGPVYLRNGLTQLPGNRTAAEIPAEAIEDSRRERTVATD